MRLPKYSLLGAFLGTGIALGGLYHQRSTRQAELAWFRHENALLHYKTYQSEQTRLAAATAAPAAPPLSPTRRDAVPEPAGSDYRNEGQATAQAALQTFAWACEQGDRAIVSALIHLEPEERTRVEAFLDTPTLRLRTRWLTAELMAADLLMLGILARPLPPADILSAVPIDTVGTGQAVAGTPRPIRLRLVNGAWKYELSSAELLTLASQADASLRPTQAP